MQTRTLVTALLATMAGTACTTHAQYIQKLAYTHMGDSEGENTGYDIARAGDINADGYDDLIFGSQGDFENDMFAVGSATVISGFDGAVLYRVTGEAPNDRFGIRVAGGYDFNADGRDDFMVASHLANNATGYTRLFSGADGSVIRTIHGESQGDRSGSAIDGIGDINNDGFDDYIIGDSGFGGNGYAAQGRVRVFSGQTGEVLFQYAGLPYDNLYNGVGGAGDFNNDGTPDFLLGAPGAHGTTTQGEGIVAIMSGATGSGIHVFSGEAANAGFAENATIVGDLNRDGFPEIAIGTPDHIENGTLARQGNLQVFDGASGSRLWRWWDPETFSNFADRASGGTDLDGDGSIDIVASAPWSDAGAHRAGGVAILSTAGDPSDDAPCEFQYLGDTENARLGWAVESTADLNADGIGDLVISAPGAVSQGVSVGAVYVYVSTPGYCEGDANASGLVDTNDITHVLFRLGQSGAPGIPGDVNADGKVNTDDIQFVLFRLGHSG